MDDNDKYEKNFDPSDKYYQDLLNNLKKAETEGSLSNQTTNTNAKNLGKTERKMGSGERTISNLLQKKSNASKRKTGFNRLLQKKNGPAVVIAGGLAAGGIAIGTLITPATFILQFAQLIKDGLNVQFPGMNARASALIKTKTSQVTSGLCGEKVNIRCKFSSMSEKQAKNFEKAGIKVISGEGKTITGRLKPTEFEFEGKKISASNLSSELKTNPRLMIAFDGAYPKKFAGLSDAAWKSMAKLRNITKKEPDLGDGKDPDKTLKKLQEEVNGKKADGSSHVKGYVEDESGNKINGDQKPIDGEFSKAEANSFNAATDNVASDALKATENATESAAAKTVGKTVLLSGQSAVNLVSATGVVDAGCNGYLLVKAISYAAKTARAAQLVKFAMVFLTIADQIKARTAKSSVVSWLGNLLMKEATEIDEATGQKKLVGSASEGIGFSSLAYAKTKNPTTRTTRFMTGGGFAGRLDNLVSMIKKAVPGDMDKTCKFMANPFVIVGSLAVGALAWVGTANPFTTAVFTPINAAKAAGVISLSAMTIFLPDLLKDMVAGVLVDKTTVGADASDAIVSGSSNMLGDVAKYGGNAPLTPAQAVDFNNYKNEVLAQEAEKDRLTLSPFDPTNRNTFLGKIVFFLMPFASKLSSISSIISSFPSIIAKSFSLIMPQASLANNSESQYSTCQDIEYSKLGVATDVFCNVSYGITKGLVNRADPIEVVDNLLDFVDPVTNKKRPLIDETSGEPIDVYKGFVNNCINRDDPIVASVYSVDDPSGREVLVTGEIGASECMFNESSEIMDFPTTWSSCGIEPAPNPQIGYVFINKSGIEVIGGDDECQNLRRHYYYLANGYLYLHYVDMRVDSGMDELPTDDEISGNKLTSPVESWDRTPRDGKYPDGIPAGQCSDHGDVDLCPDYNYKVSKPGHGTYDATGDALDIAGSANEDFYAAHDGRIVSIRSDGHSAMLIEIEGESGSKTVRTLYAHVNIDESLKEGNTVDRGQKLGTISSTYSSPHIHFEMQYDGKYIKACDIPSFFE